MRTPAQFLAIDVGEHEKTPARLADRRALLMNRRRPQGWGAQNLGLGARADSDAGPGCVSSRGLRVAAI
jgi:hypothetical protein